MRNSSCYIFFLLNILKETAIILAVVIIDFSTQSGTNLRILTSKKYNVGVTPYIQINVIFQPNINFQVPFWEKVDSTIHLINHYPVDNTIGFANAYPLDLFGK